MRSGNARLVAHAPGDARIARVPRYNAYLIDTDGRIAKRDVIVCEDEEQAKGFAKQMVDGYAIELWHEARMIASFEPER